MALDTTRTLHFLSIAPTSDGIRTRIESLWSSQGVHVVSNSIEDTTKMGDEEEVSNKVLWFSSISS